eukprot:s217_g14.t1
MPQVSLYDVLLVDQHATLDEIKLAFKKRALQVHPDKGGSKEAFHLVYEALETLADPQARQKYDNGMANTSTDVPPERSTGYKKTSRTCAHPTAQNEARPEKGQKSRNKRRADGSNVKTKPAEPKTPQSKQTKLLIKIRDILKQLPRDVRSDAITKQFSQKQRLILEKWMVDMSRAQGQEGPLAVESQDAAAQTLHPTPLPDGLRSCTVVALPASSTSFSPKESKKQSAKPKTRNKKREPRTHVRSSGGFIKKSGSSYSAGICFDAILIHTKSCDFKTGLEYLVVLTAVKQKMRDPQSTDISFEERLQQALVSSAEEHGEDLAELKLRFLVMQPASFFIGAQVQSPEVRSVEQLGKMRRILAPFRQYAKIRGKANYFWQYSPLNLQNAWGRFQKAVAEAWKVGGRDSSGVLQMMRVRHQARIDFRNTQLQQWERGHMAMQDKNKHRPFHLRKRNGAAALERWERRQMALQDRNIHRPRKLRVHLSLRRSSDTRSRKLLALKRLLVRWDRILKREAQLLEKKQRRALQRRKVQWKKDREERRRQEALNRKRLREEERCRREAVRKRMRSDLTMDEILGERRDMNGVSLSLLPYSSQVAPWIQAPVACSAWPKAVVPQFPAPAPVKVKDCFEGVSPSSDENVKGILEKACKALIEAKAELDRLDSKVGDADCGSTMAKAASSILEKQEQLPMADPKAFCACLSDLLGKTMGGSSGVLLSIMFMGMSSHLDGSNGWSAGPAALKAGLQAMMDAGGAAPGARTMLDALVPAADALVEQKGLAGAAAAAKEGTEKTKSMKPKAGRSENVPESVLKGVPDPGAKAVELVFAALT